MYIKYNIIEYFKIFNFIILKSKLVFEIVADLNNILLFISNIYSLSIIFYFYY
jgi:hypothetical protein